MILVRVSQLVLSLLLHPHMNIPAQSAGQASTGRISANYIDRDILLPAEETNAGKFREVEDI